MKTGKIILQIGKVTTDSNIGYFVAYQKGFFTYRSSDNGVFKFNRNDIVERYNQLLLISLSIVEGDSDFYLKLLNTSITNQAMLQAEGDRAKSAIIKKI